MSEGWISEFWEQGMEGEFFRIFQDRAFADGRDSGWHPDGMHVLSVGDALTIYGEDRRILWAGVIRARRCGFLNLRKLYPSNPDWCPEDVSLTDWNDWFRQNPPLEAVFRKGRD